MRTSEPSVGFEYPEERFPPGVSELVESRLVEERAEIVFATLRRVIAEILSHTNPALTASAMAFAAGLEINEGRSEVELARFFGVTKQAFSRRVTEISKALGLSPSRAMRSESARETFRKKQLCKPKTQSQRAMESLKSATLIGKP